MVNIDKETHSIGVDNYYKTEYEKKKIILGGSFRKEDYHIIHLKKKDYGLTTRWPTFSISRTGVIYQHYDPKGYSDYLGNKELDKQSISIVLENMGMVYYDYENNKHMNWTNDICPDDLVFERNWKGNRYWERYSKEQFTSTVELCKYVCDKYEVPFDCVGHNSKIENSNEFEGIMSKSNLDMDYTDLNPSFDFRSFLKELNIPTEKKDGTIK